MTERIRVAVAGARGKMGAAAVTALANDPRFDVAGLLVRSAGQAQTNDIPAYTEPEALISEQAPMVWLDLTDARSVAKHVDIAFAHGIRAVVGATGYTQDDLDRWQQFADETKLGAIVAPNFAIGALLMMRFAAEAAKFLPIAEIIELHHDGKKDAPSGTAKRTAKLMAEARDAAAANDVSGQTRNPAEPGEQSPAARGETWDGTRIHSVRLPGLVAHQEVMFGGTGETLTIRHDSLSRDSFMPGVLAACDAVMHLSRFVYGLEHILW